MKSLSSGLACYFFWSFISTASVTAKQQNYQSAWQKWYHLWIISYHYKVETELESMQNMFQDNYIFQLLMQPTARWGSRLSEFDALRWSRNKWFQARKKRFSTKKRRHKILENSVFYSKGTIITFFQRSWKILTFRVSKSKQLESEFATLQWLQPPKTKVSSSHAQK
jgi:hypothetical protein